MRNNGEFWIHVKACDGGECYDLTVIEKKAMLQDVTANEILDALNSKGFIALDIHFETIRHCRSASRAILTIPAPPRATRRSP